MTRLFGLLAVATFSALSAGAQTPHNAAPLPTDSAVVTGRLPNGLRYFVRRNSKPEKRAELRLVVNAGSILEDDGQQGLAHFVEHMAFDGTRRFAKQEIVNFLESVGMRFGADVNAYTSFDETVYMLQIPTDTARIVAKAFDVLEDWATSVTFAPSEVRKERGVVIEEWRTGRNASTRVSYKQFPVLLHGSRYALRIPIGTKENLETFPESLAVKFYHDWYRPDLMSVVAVGDFDARAIVATIRERFSKIPARRSPRPRTYADVPDHAETLVSIATDKEYPVKTVTLAWLKPRQTVRTVGDLRSRLVAGFYDGMMNQRFQEITQRPDAPFAFAGSGRGELVRTRSEYQLLAGVKESEFVPAADALLAEAERVRRFGFSASELDRARLNYLRAVEQRYAERAKTESGAFASQYVSAALSGVPIVGIEHEYALDNAIVPSITLDEINTLSRTTFSDSNRVVLVAAPDQPEVKVPDAAAMLAVFDRTKSAQVTAYVDSTSSAPLVPKPPAPGKVAAVRTLPETGIIEWTLSNGARMLLKPTDFKEDEVLFHGQSPGGASLVPDSDVVNVSAGGAALNVSGVGSFNQVALQKKLAGKRASVGTSVGDESEVASGRASRRDLETLFQLTWLHFTQPRVDSAAYRAFVSQARAVLGNQRNQPGAVFEDTITRTMTRYNPRVHLFTPEIFDSVNLRRTLDIYRDRFADAGGFTFFLVGAFVPDSVRPLVERYLASLPSLGRKEKALDVGIRPPAGVVQKVVHRGVEPKASTRLIFTGPCAYSYENRQVLSELSELLDIRLREVLREDKGGTYGVGVSANCTHIPYEEYEVEISFGSAPERVDELVGAVFAVIDSVKAGVVSDSNLTKISEIELRQHETALKENGAWIASMVDADEDGRDQRDFLRLPELVKKITKQQLRDAARQYLRKEQYARFTLLPEQNPQPGTAKP
jgi:zinc protease